MPHPSSRDCTTEAAEQSSIYEKEEEKFVIPQAHAGRQPRAVVIHLQNALPARRAVVRAIWFSSLAFLAEAQFARGFDRKGWCVWRYVAGQNGIGI